MRAYWFLACSLALAAAVGPAMDLAAGCRCGKAARKQCRQGRRAARRGYSGVYVAPSQPGYVSPYPDSVQPVGAVGETEVVWQCQFDRKGNKIGCSPVRVPVVTPAPKPVPDPISKVEPVPPSKAPEPPTPVDDDAVFGEPAAFHEPPDADKREQASETESNRLNVPTDLEPKASVISDAPHLVTEHFKSDPPE